MLDLVELLDHVVARQAVTRKPGAIGTKSGFGSMPPIDLDAMELRDLLAVAGPGAYAELEPAALEFIERPSKVSLGAYPECGEAVLCAFDRVAGECGACGEWLSRADAVRAAVEYCENTWLKPVEIERETRGWGSPVTVGRVRTWRWRGWIAPDDAGCYCLADVLGLIDRQAAEVA
ncbi:hypothetical protein [Amycolatopsis sp. cmx-8-4]|uniref:hypothetical protein n=1 Tax=Amycolatopsis sp. cmx-8-4 TaxID=2790947 RepID=UPI00397BE159